MLINDTIKFFRTMKNIPSSSMFPDHSKSYYSKLENGRSSIKINELNNVLNRLELTTSEFFFYFDDGFDGEFVNLFRDCSIHPEDHMRKENLLKHYYSIEMAYSKNSKILAQYYSIKSHFLGKWPNIKSFSNTEKEHIINYLTEKSFYTYYDYVLFSNSIVYFDRRQTLDVTTRMLPIAWESFRDHETKKYAYTAYINIITARIYNKEYDEAKLYIEMAEKEDIKSSNYFFKFSIQYLKNMILFIETEDLVYLNKIYNFISLVEDAGDSSMANLLKEEVSNFALKSKKISDGEIYPNTLMKDQ
ncbi:hypothetical protein [Enterococcus wangshanyuanii]|uniref:Transcriptional regulator n=1 Tax=Enterococcus wangshanyuanii TaxID=2005703 RepID=A0ABQ1PWJ8_9ENTE|nr:hypothetical protein [Enterococcus wangshanyuanii]GGD04827.1 transcriptional regulator [Enterococcus wangshanyuanii]